MTNYNTNESVIYKIHCVDNSCEFVYFGSTNDYKARKRLHKFDCDNINGKNYNLKVYETIRAHGGFGNWIMEIVEVFPCENKRDLRMREQEYIELEKNKINSVRAFRTPEEKKIYGKEYNKQFYLANKDELKKYQKQYRLENKAEILEQRKQYRLSNKDKIAEKHKQYDLANKEHISEQKRLYYLANKERILERNRLSYLRKKEDKNQIESI